ncbi:MAG: PAS domain S-box protein [Leptolyngbyaceae cyanobacterium SL_7_1]|nr:PAS domain S-box protein [Leptolyngbyaceae cyanobacterium SL_7_1]
MSLATGNPCSDVVIGVYRHDGTLVWLRVNAQPLAYTKEALPYAVVQSFSDITERKSTEAKLRESEERFRNLTENIEEVFWILDPEDWRVIYVSPAFETVWGISRESLYHDRRVWIDSIHPVDRASKDWYNTCLPTRYDQQYRIVRPDGTIRWIRDRSFPVYNQSGRIYRLTGIAEDITQQKLQDSRLRLLESVVVNANDSIVVTEGSPIDQPGPRIVYVNDAFTRLTGYTPAEVLGKTPRILQGENTDRATLNKLRTTLQTWQPLVVELLNYRKDHSEFWIELSVVPVSDEAGSYTHWVAIQRDITQRKRFEDELMKTLVTERELNELKSRFVTMTSHEFRTPLSIILSAAELLEHYRHTWTTEETLEQLHLIQSTVQHMTRLLEDILFIGQTEAAKLEPNPILINSTEFCQKLIAELQLGIGKHHDLKYQPSHSIPPVHLDAKLLRQILNNLLSNATKYSPQGSSIELRVSTDGDRSCFKFKIGALGFPPKINPTCLSFSNAPAMLGLFQAMGWDWRSPNAVPNFTRARFI